MKCICFSSIIGGVLLSVPAHCQPSPLSQTTTGHVGKTSREALLEKGVAVDPLSLVKALTNANPEIRGLAAMRLATDHIKDATGDVKAALQKETNPQTALRMAGSLFQLDPENGKPYVISLCQNATFPPIANISAARVLGDLDPAQSAKSCASTLESIMNNKSVNPDDTGAALSVLAVLQPKLDESAIARIRKTSENFISRNEISLRIAATEWLSKDSSNEAQTTLIRAINSETNQGMRDLMRRSLESRVIK